jgi:bis(5'-nucleosyl)-tetraphosphatase (symmetrical)
MSDYAIGDIQGCYSSLLYLLEKINFDDRSDRLWFVGDLVNRGHESLKVVRFIKNLPIKPQITLGNHDLHLLAKLFCPQKNYNHRDDTLSDILDAPDAEEIGHWLRSQSILIYSQPFQLVMTHAGIPPIWSLPQAQALARELELVLHSDDFICFLENMYGNDPNCWSDSLQGLIRLRTICNYFTRMRFCTPQGALDFSYKGNIEEAPPELLPWFQIANSQAIDINIIFGHWAALRGISNQSNIYPLDTGCYWGGQLTALRLQDNRRFSVRCQ